MACTGGLDRPILVVALVFYSPPAMPVVMSILRAQLMQHFVDARGYRFHILEDDDFYLIYNPIAKILPDSVDEDEVDSELEEVQTRFAELLPGLVNGTETTLSGEFGDYYFPGHFQKLRLMYMYFQNLGFLCPETAEALVESLRPLGNRWFAEAEFEGAEAPELWGNFLLPQK